MKRLTLSFLLILLVVPVYAQERLSLAEQREVLKKLGPCKTDGILPDRKCTPGLANPKVTQANIKRTICVAGFTKKIRPPVSYTGPLKTAMLSKYGFAFNPENFEFDHLISLQLGGHPSDLRNLWPEPYAGKRGKNGARIKDKFENYLKNEICKGRMTLAEAQRQISTNWFKYWQDAGEPSGARNP